MACAKVKKILLSLLVPVMSGCAALGVGAAGGAAAGTIEATEQPRYGAGTQTAAILSNVVYVPAKIIFAGAGAATSGVAYLVTFGDREVSGPIWRSSVGGDYVVTPPMIAGDREVKFVG